MRNAEACVRYEQNRVCRVCRMKKAARSSFPSPLRRFRCEVLMKCKLCGREVTLQTRLTQGNVALHGVRQGIRSQATISTRSARRCGRPYPGGLPTGHRHRWPGNGSPAKVIACETDQPDQYHAQLLHPRQEKADEGDRQTCSRRPAPCRDRRLCIVAGHGRELFEEQVVPHCESRGTGQDKRPSYPAGSST